MADNSKSYEDLRTKLHESRGGDRLKCWIELEMLKRQDPEFKASKPIHNPRGSRFHTVTG